jgi:hypothetical protein
MPVDDQLPAVDGQSGITVGHENLRADVGLRQATPHPEVLLRSTRTVVTKVLAQYSWSPVPLALRRAGLGALVRRAADFAIASASINACGSL